MRFRRIFIFQAPLKAFEATNTTFPFLLRHMPKENFNKVPCRKSFNPSHHTSRIEWLINWFHQQCWDKSDRENIEGSRIDWCLFLFRLGEKKNEAHGRDKSVYSLPTMKFLAKKEWGESGEVKMTPHSWKFDWKIFKK